MSTAIPASRHLARGGRVRAAFVALVALLLAITPLTAVLTLGWLMRVQRREALVALARGSLGVTRPEALARLAAITGVDAVETRLPGWRHGLAGTVRAGVVAAVGLMLVTLPHAAMLALSWWAGWENSFNKGYEQASVGPTLALAGMALAAVVLAHLPLLTAHAAVEGRVSAFLDVATARAVVNQSGWRHVALTAASLAASLPLFAHQIAIAFLTTRRPDLEPAIVRAEAGWLHLLATLYLVLALVVLRWWAARLYARAVASTWPAGATRARQTAAALGIPVPPEPLPCSRGRAARLLGTLLASACWLAFVALLYVAQFANHAWWNWLNQPLVGLPWVFRVF